MKLTLRNDVRLRPLSSFVGFLDLKTGVTIALLFALINKVAGVYGLIAMLTGAGGSFAQLSMYIYSVAGLVALTWGLRAVNEEDPKRTLYFAHLFFADHIFSTAWTVHFAVQWWIYTPHDGRRVSNSPAQRNIIDGYIGKIAPMPADERAAAAEMVWQQEKHRALAIIILGWLIKFYFAALLYSFAHHLRRGTYRALPLSRAGPTAHGMPLYRAEEEDELDLDEAADAFYAHSPATPAFPLPASNGHAHTQGKGTPSSGSFADFVSAPKRGGPRAGTSLRTEANVGGSTAGSVVSEGEEVLFEDEDGRSVGSTSASGSTGGVETQGLGTARREASGSFRGRT